MIENCYHRGTLGGDAAGGIAGINGGMIRNCYHAGNCRVVGEYNLGDVVNSYYDGELSGGSPPRMRERPGDYSDCHIAYRDHPRVCGKDVNDSSICIWV